MTLSVEAKEVIRAVVKNNNSENNSLLHLNKITAENENYNLYIDELVENNVIKMLSSDNNKKPYKDISSKHYYTNQDTYQIMLTAIDTRGFDF